MMELTYTQALRAYWRVYWPSQLLGAALLFAAEWFLSSLSWIWLLLIAIFVSAGALYLFVPRICSRPYRGFSIVLVSAATGAAQTRLRGLAHWHIWAFLWWRQFFAGLLAAILAIPLNLLLSRFGLQLNQAVANAAGILVIGPLLLKMLIGTQFAGVRLEARKGTPATPAIA